MTFQAWKMKFLNSMTFSVSHDLYEPCKGVKSQERKRGEKVEKQKHLQLTCTRTHV